MKDTINKNQFINWFRSNEQYKNNFSYKKPSNNSYYILAKCPPPSTPVKNKPSGDVPGRKLCQQGSPFKISASPVISNSITLQSFYCSPVENG